MIDPYHSIILVILAGFCDWSRGGKGQWARVAFVSHKHIFLFLLASLYVYVIGFTYWAIIFVVWMTFFGTALGTGDPVGKIVSESHSEHGNDDNKLGRWEKWQYIFKTDNGFTNHAILGAGWTLPAIALTAVNFNWFYVFVAHVVSFYVMAFIVRLLPQTERWSRLEMARSAGAMAITLAGVNYA